MKYMGNCFANSDLICGKLSRNANFHGLVFPAALIDHILLFMVTIKINLNSNKLER